MPSCQFGVGSKACNRQQVFARGYRKVDAWNLERISGNIGESIFRGGNELK